VTSRRFARTHRFVDVGRINFVLDPDQVEQLMPPRGP
jgi:hypothetical protein